MKKQFQLIITITFLLFSTIIIGQGIKNQTLITKALANESIKNQFEILTSKSGDFQDFKNLKHANLNKFKANFLDSLKAFDVKYNSTLAKINSQKTEIKELQSNVKIINDNLTLVTAEKDSVGLFGMRMTKNTYNVLLWSIISGLLLTTLLLFYKFRTSNTATKFAKNSFNEIESEFESHKKKSLEREQLLRRKLQDEINKQRNVN